MVPHERQQRVRVIARAYPAGQGFEREACRLGRGVLRPADLEDEGSALEAGVQPQWAGRPRFGARHGARSIPGKVFGPDLRLGADD